MLQCSWTSATLALLVWGATASSQTPGEPLRGEGTVTARPAVPSVFRRRAEPDERAFSMLVPEGWSLEGGILRIDPTAAGGPAQSFEAKLDLTLSDARGRVRMRRVADWYFCDVKHMPAAQLGLFPPCSNYQGMTVWPLRSATEYLSEVLFPREHQAATALEVRERKRLRKLARGYQRRLRKMAIPLPLEFDAGYRRWSNNEAGVAYDELAFTLIEDRGQLAGGQWANRETLSFRAPRGELEAWGPVFALMLRSVELRAAWFRGEFAGQLNRAGI